MAVRVPAVVDRPISSTRRAVPDGLLSWYKQELAVTVRHQRWIAGNKGLHPALLSGAAGAIW